MRSTWTVGKLGDTEIRIHVTFLALAALYAAVAVSKGHTGASLAQALVLLTLASVCVIAHELGHVLVARAYGIATPDVTLTALGAVSRLERHPDSSHAALTIAAAGPVVSLVIAAACLVLAALEDGRVDFHLRAAAHAGIFIKLFWTNLFVAAVNLLPALPMDGGKILRAALSPALGAKGATGVTVALGLATAALFVLAGARYDLFFVVLAGLVALGSAREWSGVVALSYVRELTAASAASREFLALAPEARLLPLVDAVFSSRQRAFPVLAGGLLVGVVTRADFARGLAGGRETVDVAAVMRRSVPWAEASEPLRRVLERMRAQGLSLVVVLDRERGFLGVVTLEGGEDAALEQEAQNAAVLGDEPPTRTGTWQWAV